jgi:hypothetical protein
LVAPLPSRGLADLNLKRRRLAVAVLAVTLIAAGLAVTLADVRPIGGVEGLWHTSQMYNSNMNVSYCVVFYLVNFTFLYTEQVPTDSPIPVHFMVTFSDGLMEVLNTTIGGWLGVPPRVVHSNHTNPGVAIVSSTSNDHWYDWYYAVSV